MKFRCDRIPSKFNRDKNSAPRSKHKILSQIYAKPPQSRRRIPIKILLPDYNMNKHGRLICIKFQAEILHLKIP